MTRMTQLFFSLIQVMCSESYKDELQMITSILIIRFRVILGSLMDILSSSHYVGSDSWMINNKLEGVWLEAVIA